MQGRFPLERFSTCNQVPLKIAWANGLQTDVFIHAVVFLNQQILFSLKYHHNHDTWECHSKANSQRKEERGTVDWQLYWKLELEIALRCDGMCVCMHVYMCTRMFLCVHVCIYVSSQVYMCICVYICICVSVYVYVSTYECVHASIFVYLCVHIHVYLCVHVHICACISVFMSVCMHIYMCVQVYMCIWV